MTQNYLDHTFGLDSPCHTPSNMTHSCDGKLHCLNRPHISGNSLPRTSDRHTLQCDCQYECSSLLPYKQQQLFVYQGTSPKY